MIPTSIDKHLERNFLVLIIFLSVFLNGSIEWWSRGVLYVFIGIYILFFSRPSKKIPKIVNFSALGFLFWSLLPVLPIKLFFEKKWRATLVNDYQLELGNSISPQPFVSLEAWLCALVFYLWFITLLRKTWSIKDLIYLIKSFTIVVSSIALLSCFFRITNSHISIWGWEEQVLSEDLNQFGPYSNFNHFATVLAIGSAFSVILFYLNLVKHRVIQASLYLIIGLPSIISLYLTGSKGGIVIFIVGILIFFLGTASISKLKENETNKYGILKLVALPVIFLLFSCLILSKSDLSGGVKGRLDIYKDSGALITDHIFTGVGLGNFERVFPFYRNQYQNTDRVIHPESSLIWLTTETGLIGFGLVFLILFVLVSSFLSNLRKETYRTCKYKLCALIGFFIIIIHSCFDIPAHIFSTASLALILISITLPDSRPSINSNRKNKAFFSSLIGIVPILIGSLFLLYQFSAFIYPGKASAKKLSLATTAGSQVFPKEALNLIEKAILWEPLNYNFYIQRAQLKHRNRLSKKEVLDDFRIARTLEPSHPGIPQAEAQFWEKRDIKMAFPAWRTLIANDPARKFEYFRAPLKAYRKNQTLYPKVSSLAHSDPELHSLFLKHLDQENLNREIKSIITSPKILNKFTTQDKMTFFNLWYARGDLELYKKTQTSKDAALFNTSLLEAKVMAQEESYKEAVTTALGSITSKKILIENDIYQEFIKAIAVDIESANIYCATIEKSKGNKKILHLLRSLIDKEKNNWKSAWKNLNTYLIRTI